MYTATGVIFFKALSSVHAGAGADLGVVDLPIQRERHTGFPKIESSGVKGCLREAFEGVEGKPADFIKVAFGPEEKQGNETRHSGAYAFTDAKILLFPVRSARGVFAYATCPLVLERLQTDFGMAKLEIPKFPSVKDKVLVTGKALVIPGTKKVVLEEYTYEAEEDDDAKILAGKLAEWLKKPGDLYLNENLIILPDDEFKDFVQNATEIITRIRIDNNTGTVAKGALFTEELLPTETVMYSVAMASAAFLPEEEHKDSATIEDAKGEEAEYLMKKLEEWMPDYLQIGGAATIGKGLVSVSVQLGGK
jgi:CRISPR-associated protein Cmr4